MDEIVKCWDDKAAQWKKLVGDRGDNNRFFNSDPVLWNFAGNVNGLKVLDAGCGTGYLSVMLAEKGASVVAVDISPNMIKEAKAMATERACEIDFHVDSCSKLESIKNESMDLVISNYVLMDLPDFPESIANFHRVLKKAGKAVCVFSHPYSSGLTEDENYFDEVKKIDRWGPFDSDFIFFHRPLSYYWSEFKKAGFAIEEFDEPIAKDPFVAGFKEEWRQSYRRKPWSVAFLLKKN